MGGVVGASEKECVSVVKFVTRWQLVRRCVVAGEGVGGVGEETLDIGYMAVPFPQVLEGDVRNSMRHCNFASSARSKL